jgi:hypothetical protein
MANDFDPLRIELALERIENLLRDVLAEVRRTTFTPYYQDIDSLPQPTTERPPGPRRRID